MVTLHFDNIYTTRFLWLSYVIKHSIDGGCFLISYDNLAGYAIIYHAKYLYIHYQRPLHVTYVNTSGKSTYKVVCSLIFVIIVMVYNNIEQTI